MGLESDLSNYFGQEKRSVVLIGVGNPMRGDDRVGVRIIELLENKDLPDVLLLNTEASPEAFTGKIEEIKPTHILIIDAANLGGKPGDCRLVRTDEIGGQTVTTHSLPLNIFMSYIKKTTGVDAILLGVQPKNIEFFSDMSKEVERAAESIASILYKVLSR